MQMPQTPCCLLPPRSYICNFLCLKWYSAPSRAEIRMNQLKYLLRCKNKERPKTNIKTNNTLMKYLKIKINAKIQDKKKKKHIKILNRDRIN